MLKRIIVTIQHDEIDDYAEATGELVTRHLTDNDKSASEFSTKPRDDYIELLGCIMRGLVRAVQPAGPPRRARGQTTGGPGPG